MNHTPILKLLVATVLAAGCVHADVAYTIPGGSSDSGGALSGTIDFFLTNCNIACVLNIEFTNTQSGSSMSVAQAMSGVTFKLSNTGTSVGSVSTVLSNGSGGAVETVSSGGTIGSTTTTPARWKISQASKLYDLTTLSGGQPEDLIAGTGAGSGDGSGFGSHAPTLVGPVLFQITGIKGLSTSTDISDVSVLFGTAPDKTTAETSANCASGGGTGGSCSTGDIGTQYVPSAPEPVSFLLSGTGLIALAFMRRRSLFSA